MKRRIILTALILLCFTQFATPNRNIAEGKCTCPAGKYQTNLGSQCPDAQVKEAAEIVPLNGLIYWL
jgi:hypothetical protein